MYRQHWPGLTMLVLPTSADDLGIGASRYWIQLFAEQVCEPNFQFCFVLDDSVQYWKGAIPRTDPNVHPMWTVPAVRNKTEYVDTFLEEILWHFQNPKFVETDLTKIAVLGFKRLNYTQQHLVHVYKRTHVYSALILNVKLLKDKAVRFF